MQDHSPAGGGARTADVPAFKEFRFEQLVAVRHDELPDWITGLPASLQERITAYVDALIFAAEAGSTD